MRKPKLLRRGRADGDGGGEGSGDSSDGAGAEVPAAHRAARATYLRKASSQASDEALGWDERLKAAEGAAHLTPPVAKIFQCI
eukprot:5966161-Prymnesium_polylepis.1